MMSMRCMVTLVNSGIAASPAERRILIDGQVDSINILPDRLTVHVAVAPPFLVTLQEVGLTRVVNPWCRRPDVTVLLPVIGGLPDVSPCASQSSRYKRKSIREAGLMIGGSDDVVKALVNPVAPA